MNRTRVGHACIIVVAATLATPVLGRQAAFHRTIGDSAVAEKAAWLQPTSDGGFITVGVSDPGQLKSMVLKLDSGGVVQWRKDYSMGPAPLLVPPTQIMPASAGGNTAAGYILCGRITNSSTIFNGDWIIRTDTAGTPLWVRHIDPAYAGSFFRQGPSMAPSPWSPGEFVEASSGEEMPALRRLDADGNQLFLNHYFDTSQGVPNTSGGFNGVHAVPAQGPFPAGFVAVGWLAVPPVAGGPAKPQTLVARTNLAGAMIWAKTYRQEPYDNVAWGVDLAANGDLLVTGWTESIQAGGGGYLMRLGAPGNVIWRREFPSFTTTRSVEELPNGFVLLGGSAGAGTASPPIRSAVMFTNGSGAAAPLPTTTMFAGPLAPADRGACAFRTVDGGCVLLGQAVSYGGLDEFQVVKCAPGIPALSGCFETSIIDVWNSQGVNVLGVNLEPLGEDNRWFVIDNDDLGIDSHLQCMGCDLNDTCPTGAIAEGEPASGDINGGCNSTPPIWSTLSPGQTICGDFWLTTAGVRDTDWFRFTVPAIGIPRLYTATVAADVDVDFFILGLNAGCPATFEAFGDGTCPARATACLSEGEYIVFVAPRFTSPAPITIGSSESKYVLRLNKSWCPLPCQADFNGDGAVDGTDLGTLIASWGSIDDPEGPAVDLNGDSIVDGADLGIFLASWGACG